MLSKIALSVLVIMSMSGCYSDYRCHSEMTSIITKYKSIEIEKLPAEWELINKYCPINKKDQLLALYVL